MLGLTCNTSHRKRIRCRRDWETRAQLYVTLCRMLLNHLEEPPHHPACQAPTKQSEPNVVAASFGDLIQLIALLTLRLHMQKRKIDDHGDQLVKAEAGAEE